MSFYDEVIKPDPRFTSDERCFDLELLEPVTRAKAVAIFADLEKAEPGRWMVYETFRSSARQRYLFILKKTKKKDVGVHNKGCAVDFVRRDKRGHPSWEGDFTILGRIAKAHGMVWGGAWPSLHDGPHVQRVALREQPGLLDDSWFPDEDYKAF